MQPARFSSRAKSQEILPSCCLKWLENCIGLSTGTRRISSYQCLLKEFPKIHARSQPTVLADFLAPVPLVGRCSRRLYSKRAQVSCMAYRDGLLNGNQHYRCALTLTIGPYTTWQHQPFTTEVSSHSWPSCFGPPPNLSLSTTDV